MWVAILSLKTQGQYPDQGRATASGDQVPVCASRDALPGFGQEHQPVAADVCAVELVDGTQTNFAGAAGMSATVVRAKAEKRRPCSLKNGKSTTNSVLVSPCEYSRIHSRIGRGYADHPSTK